MASGSPEAFYFSIFGGINYLISLLYRCILIPSREDKILKKGRANTMTIYKVTIKCERERFMESPLIFSQEMNVIADSYDQAINYVRERFVWEGQKELDIKYERVAEVMALFDVRDGDEKIIV